MTIYVSDKLQATAATVSGDPTPTTSWQWLRNSSAISGATSSDYVVSADDVGANISVIQSAINMLGTATATSASDGPVQAFTPSLLFRGSTAGTWYEPADMTTLFRDAAGTLPVTAVEQPVGLMLDKSKNGVGTNGTKRVNLLTKTEQFDDVVWFKSGTTITPNATVAPDGTLTADAVFETNTNDFHVLEWRGNQSTNQVSDNYTFSVAVKANGRASVRISAYQNSSPYPDINATFNLLDGSYTTGNSGSGVFVSASSTNLGNGWYRCTITGRTGQATINNFQLTYSSNSYQGDPTKGLYIWGADLRLASEASTLPTYQKITDTWYNTLPGNHAFNSSGNSANFPVLSARYNLLTKTEDFSSADWSKYNITATSDTLTLTSTTGAAYKFVVIPANVQHRVYCKVKAGTNQFAYLNVQYGNGGEYATQVFDVQNGIVGQSAVIGTGMVLASPSIVQDGAWWVCSMVVTVSATTASASTVAIGFANALTGNSLDSYGNPLGCVSGRTLMVKQADLRVANDALGQPAYQRVNTSTDYDTVGFKPYLRFNGTNQWLQTNSIDLTYGDKMFVCAGVRKLSDYMGEATGANIAEFSSSVAANNGSWALTGSIGYQSNRKYSFQSKGTLSFVEAYTTNASYAAPVTNIVSGISDLNGSPSDYARLKVNNTQVAENTANQGTGNYGNYPLYIGARAGTSLWFNGRLYSLIVAGKLANAVEITETEKYVNGKTAAY